MLATTIGVIWPRWRWKVRAVLVVVLSAVTWGCKSAGDYHRQADNVADKIISAGQKQALGHTEPFTIETPAEQLRRKLLLRQHLLYAAPASLGVAALKPLKHWPDDSELQVGKAPAPATMPSATQPVVSPLTYIPPIPSAPTTQPAAQSDIGTAPQPAVTIAAATQPVAHMITLSLDQALEVAAHNSHDYQTQKEKVYTTALDLDLERNNFRTIFSGALGSEVLGLPNGGHNGEADLAHSATGGITRDLKNGMTVTAAITADLVKMLTGDHVSASGLVGDASITIPLLRGAGEWVVAEPLTQAQRNTIYAIRTFERYKSTFAVQVASSYLNVLEQRNQITNAVENYVGATSAVREAIVQAQTGQVPQTQVGQAVQQQLSARASWISARQSYAQKLDQFKMLLGLPVDANIELQQNELQELTKDVESELPGVAVTQLNLPTTALPANAPVVLVPPTHQGAGPLELNPRQAIHLAFTHRLDLRNAEGAVYDAERQIPIGANAFLPGATITMAGSAGGSRGVGDANLPTASLRLDEGRYDALLNLNLPLERTAERNAYREDIINLHQTVRNFQDLADRIKLEIRDELRTLLQSREGLRIQTRAVRLAEQQVNSTRMLFNLGRPGVDIRDVLQAQSSLTSAKNALTSALVGYRVAELNLQSDMGVLKVNANGLWTEYQPGK